MAFIDRRKFLSQSVNLAAGLTGISVFSNFRALHVEDEAPFFTISLAEWSLHRTIQAGQMTNMDFPAVARKVYGIGVVEYVNSFFMDKANDLPYLNELLSKCHDNDVKNHLIMCDDEGPLGAPDDKKRLKAVENHYKWVDAAKHLGCTSIRVNTYGEGSPEDIRSAAADGLNRLALYAADRDINVLVENHGGSTSDGNWMEGLMKKVEGKNIGTLPDFGNFCMKYSTGADRKCVSEYDRYKGVSQMMPFAKGVSAKTRDFDAKGNCIETDYNRMMKIVKDSGFKGYAGIEFEGKNCSEEVGIKNTKLLLEKVLKNFSSK
ncbi:MAG: TIM barrel protein [Bacteroidetes bacterium]|nr:TIM barrel protein [Bacteroidota bacterium]